MPQPRQIVAVTRKLQAASFQQRIEGYLPLLARHGLHVTVRELPHSTPAQLRLLRELRAADAVWWQRHLLTPWLLPALRPLSPKLVFDYDDPLTLSARTGRPSLTRRVRFAAMLRRCRAAVAASDHLAGLARPHCREVHVVPMAVDLPDATTSLDARPGPVRLLWLGSRATQPYLDEIAPVLAQLGETLGDTVRLRLVAHEPMAFGPLAVEYEPWSPAAQDAALRACHVGLCPMPDTLWTRGKCPYKVLQYMAHGMPFVGSHVGENPIVAGIGDTARGLCATTPDEWLAALHRLIDDAALRGAMGQRGRLYIEQHHARERLAERIAAILRAAATPV